MTESRGGLPGLAVRRPVTVLMTLAALLVVGGIAFQSIPVQLLPSGFDAPFMWISVPTLPAAPSDNERRVAEPLEDQLATLPGLDSLRTIIRASRVAFRVELKGGVEVDAAHDRIRDRLDRVLPTLPEGSRQAFIWRHDPNDDPVYILGVTYPPNAEDPARTIEEHIGRRLERVPGVSRVQTWGVQQRAVFIHLEDAALRAHGIDSRSLVRRLQNDNFTLGVGAVQTDGRRVLVRVVSRFETLDSLREVPVADGVRLGDLATVRFAVDEENPEIHRINGAPAASVMVFKESTANTVATAQRLRTALADLLANDAALKGFTAETFFDQGGHITESIQQLREAAFIGGLIAVALLFMFLRSLGMTLLITLAIPLCLLATIVVLFFNGESLNVMSMMGLMLSVGMVIDNAIVVLENIDRRRRLGQDARTAAVGGTQEVALAITLATLTTLVVFLPMILLGSNPAVSFYLGRIGFPVCYALLASLLVALIYIPVAAHRFKPGRRAPMGRFFGGLQSLYGRQLGWVLRNRLISALAVLGILASSALPFSKLQHVDQVSGGVDSVRMHIFGPPSATFAELDDTIRALEHTLAEQAKALDIRAVLVRRGWSPTHIMVQVFFVDLAERTLDRAAVVEALRALLPKRPAFKGRIGWSQGGGDGGITLHVTGPDTQTATTLAQDVAHLLERLPAVEAASLEEPDSATELQFMVSRGAADRAGVSAMTIGGTLDYTLRGRRLGAFQTETGEVDLRIALDPRDRRDVSQVAQVRLRPDEGGAPVPLAGVTRHHTAPGYGKIVRRDRRTQVSIVITGDEAALFGQLQAALPGLRLPPGYAVDFGSRFKRRAQNEEGGSFALIMAVTMVFFIMGVLFESVLLPFSILLSIPLAFAGVAWTLYLTATPLDIMAIVGLIILVGVVVNNGIVLIDQVQQRRADGEPRDLALVNGGQQRVRPILMTALTTIGGLIPMAVGHAALLGIEYYPLGRVVIGGLLTGTALTLFAVPLLYSLLDDLSHLPTRVRQLASGLVWRRAPRA